MYEVAAVGDVLKQVMQMFFFKWRHRTFTLTQTLPHHFECLKYFELITGVVHYEYTVSFPRQQLRAGNAGVGI